MATVEWIGAARQDDDNGQADPARLVNCYRERLGDKYVIKSVLGMSDFVTLDGVFMREMAEVGGQIYAAHSGRVFRVLEDGTVADMAGIENAADTTISGNNGAVTIAAGGTYTHIASDGTVTTPATGAISSIGSVAFLGQRTILTEKGGARIQWSDVADATAFDGLDFATAESRDDDLIRGAAINGQFWAFGGRSIERWYLTGSGESSEFIAPIGGSTVDIGLKEFGLLAEFPNGAFFVGSDGITYIVSGGQMKPVSSRGVETSISASDPQRCFYYTDEGHKFCVLQFKDRPAWVYDISSDEWHERAEGYELQNWSAVASAQAYGRNYVGTEMGKVYRMERTNRDADGPLVRRAVSRTLEMEGRQFIIRKMQVSPRTGRAAVTQDAFGVLAVDETSLLDAGGESALIVSYDEQVARDAQIAFRFSRDRGETWGKEKRRSLGAVGKYGKLVRLHALGSFYRATVEMTLAEAAEIPIESTAFVELS